MTGADRADAGEVRTDVTAFAADRVATIAGHLFAEEDAPAAAGVAAGGEHRLQLAQPIGLALLRGAKRLQQALRLRLYGGGGSRPAGFSPPFFPRAHPPPPVFLPPRPPRPPPPRAP